MGLTVRLGGNCIITVSPALSKVPFLFVVMLLIFACPCSISCLKKDREYCENCYAIKTSRRLFSSLWFTENEK